MQSEPASDAPILSVRGLSKSFGGLKAVQDVSFEVPKGVDPRHHRPERRRQDHGVQSAQRLPDARCRSRSCSTAAASSGASRTSCARAGVGRTFQIVRPFPRMSVVDNVVIGAYVHAETDAEARRLAAAMRSRGSA